MEKLTEKVTTSQLLSQQLKSLGFSRPNFLKLLKNKDILVNEKRVKEDVLLNAGDSLTVYFSPSQRMTIEKIFEDENILIVNKPAGIEVEGEGSLCTRLNALAVHRLDRNTTGLTVLAKNKLAQKSLLDAFKNRTITKKYYAEVDGKTNFKNYTFDAFLVKDNNLSQVKIFTKKVPHSVAISTTFNTIKSSSLSLIECTLGTGKTHQIRASLAFLGHPIIGDGKYGTNEINKRYNCYSQRLHAYFIKFDNLASPLAYLNGQTFTCKPKWIKGD